MGLAPILLVLLRLLVHDWSCVKFTAWALLPYSQYYFVYWFYVEFSAWASLPYSKYKSVYWFTTGTASSLLHGHHSHTTSTTPFTGLRLILLGVF
jgi:hypothetical protein